VGLRRAKRAFDVVCAGLGVVALAPALALIAALVALDDPGPVFFRQVRVGRGGRTFRMWKFRTMRVDAESLGPQLTVGDDPRITRFGRVLRKLKFDEIPQLLNVLAGDMSLVGPRPEVPRYVGLYTPEQRRVLDLLPGITDPASIRYRDESAVLAKAADPERAYVEEIMPEKIRLNLDYAGRASLASDAAVILRTVFGGILPGRRDSSRD
jgi:lipopolysaccharide/colanic/teichoic acid biosynthesis glycosyltransferase